MKFEVRNTKRTDIEQIQKLCMAVYPDSPAWRADQLLSHLQLFPEGQFVAVETATGKIVGFSSSLIIFWDDYDFRDSWRDFTDSGMFTNHDPEDGRTLYGAEVMVAPAVQGQGVGKLLYRSREILARRFRLLRIRAGARLRGYCVYADELTAEEYAIRVIDGKIFDPTLSFQIKNGFSVLAVIPGYLRFDKESLGYAAVIEWINAEIARPEHYLLGEPKFRRHV